MEVIKILGDIYDSNVYIITKDDSCIIIDSGANLNKIKPFLKGKDILGVLLTHGHYDHSIYCNDYAKEFNCKIYANENIKMTMSDGEAIYSEDNSVINDFSNFVFLAGDEEIKLGEFDIKYYYCPGHSICSDVFIIDNQMFSGDVLFERAIGRTDLKFSNKDEMYNSLCKLEGLKFENVYSGHGEKSDYTSQMKNIGIFKRFLNRG